ncbi:hypothetical protein V2J09_017869 [Rumex salicifolius]
MLLTFSHTLAPGLGGLSTTQRRRAAHLLLVSDLDSAVDAAHLLRISHLVRLLVSVALDCSQLHSGRAACRRSKFVKPSMDLHPSEPEVSNASVSEIFHDAEATSSTKPEDTLESMRVICASN